MQAAQENRLSPALKDTGMHVFSIVVICNYKIFLLPFFNLHTLSCHVSILSTCIKCINCSSHSLISYLQLIRHSNTLPHLQLVLSREQRCAATRSAFAQRALRVGVASILHIRLWSWNHRVGKRYCCSS